MLDINQAIERLTRIQEQAKLNPSNQVSERYRTVSTIDLLDSFSDIIRQDQIKLSHKSGSNHALTLELAPRFQYEGLIGGDRCKLTLHVFNSYQGESALKVYFGIYRFICSNGLVIGSSIFEAKAKHIVGPAIDSTLERLRQSVVDFTGEPQRLFEAVDTLAESTIDRTTIERLLDNMRLPFRTYHQALQRYLEPKRRADAGDSAWLAYNRVQEIVAAPNRGQAGVELNRTLMQRFLDEVKAA